jgi:hypothetical protein
MLNTISGYEALNIIRKGQIRWLRTADTSGHMRFIERTLGIQPDPRFAISICGDDRPGLFATEPAKKRVYLDFSRTREKLAHKQRFDARSYLFGIFVSETPRAEADNSSSYT